MISGSTVGPEVTCTSLEDQAGREFLQAMAVCSPSTPLTITRHLQKPPTLVGFQQTSTILRTTLTSQNHNNKGKKNTFDPVSYSSTFLLLWVVKTSVTVSLPSLHLNPNKTKHLCSAIHGSSQHVLECWRFSPPCSSYVASRGHPGTSSSTTTVIGDYARKRRKRRRTLCQQCFHRQKDTKTI